MNVTERRKRLREILAGNDCVETPEVFDPVSARIAEDLGFQVGVMLNSIASTAVLCAPGVGMLTTSELAQHVRHICRASTISLMSDAADRSCGNALNVMRTVEELENAGTAALSLCLEDPLPFTPGKTRPVLRVPSLEEGVGRLKAALAARQDPSLVIMGRTLKLRGYDIHDAIERVKSYEKAGADGIFLDGVRTREQLEAVHAATRLPLVIDGPGAEIGDKKYLGANGVRVAARHFSFQASVKAIYDSMKALRDGKLPADLRPILASPELLAQVTQQSQYSERIKSFLN